MPGRSSFRLHSSRSTNSTSSSNAHHLLSTIFAQPEGNEVPSDPCSVSSGGPSSPLSPNIYYRSVVLIYSLVLARYNINL